MRHTPDTTSPIPLARSPLQASPNLRNFCRCRIKYLELSENCFQNARQERRVPCWITATLRGNRCGDPRERASTRPRRVHRTLTREAAKPPDWRLRNRHCDQMSTGSASVVAELVAKKSLACILRTSRLGEKTFTRHTPCTLGLHPSCIGKRSITLNNGATDADGR
jgi:hypothetical protein